MAININEKVLKCHKGSKSHKGKIHAWKGYRHKSICTVGRVRSIIRREGKKGIIDQ